MKLTMSSWCVLSLSSLLLLLLLLLTQNQYYVSCWTTLHHHHHHHQAPTTTTTSSSSLLLSASSSSFASKRTTTTTTTLTRIMPRTTTRIMASTNEEVTTTTTTSISDRYYTATNKKKRRRIVTKERSVLNPEYDIAYARGMIRLRSLIPEAYHNKTLPLMQHFVQEYMSANQDAYNNKQDDMNSSSNAIKRIMTAIQYGLKYGTGPNKYTFDVTHRAHREYVDDNEKNAPPIDFYQFGCDIFGPCMNMDDSVILGQDSIDNAMKQIQNGDNVILLANHQSEADPQVVSCTLNKLGYEREAANMYYVAGHKVTTDPLAIPFSMGRNLICIHSKKHIDSDPETKPAKQKQNLRAMNGLLDVLKSDEGTMLWVAPSGGRDRRNVDTGEVPIAPFDNKTVDMFRLMARKSKKPTHFYTLAMVSYYLCPPPDTIEAETGEQRNVRYVPVGIAMSDELFLDLNNNSKDAATTEAYTRCQADYEKLLDELIKKK